MKKYLPILPLLLALLACTLQSPQPVEIPTQTPTPAPAPVRAQPTAQSPACAVVTAASLHVRFEPDYRADIVGWFTQGTLLSVKNTANSSWWLVHGDGIDFMGYKTRMTGYVKTAFIRVQDCDPYVQTRYNSKRH